ncbi:MAG: cupin domain-containing protein [Desulfovibrio sp.]|jgi:mannose-6-phosphate isomerase-like protein (cupin superfamily)|nr:cupin domain-containing protein [Desulfovibrio sp.]
MIRNAKERVTSVGVKFGGPGETWLAQILNPDEFGNKGRLFNHNVLKPGCGLGKHRHEGEFEVYYILKGEALYNDNGNEVTVRPGDVTICPSGEEHGILNTGKEDVEFIALILFA